MVASHETEENARRRAVAAAARRRTAVTAAPMQNRGAARRGREAMERLIATAARETRRASVDDLLLEFQGTLDEFHALSAPLRAANPAYDRMYQRLIGKFLESYPTLRLNVVYLNLGKYSVDRWGPVYWRFFHLSAILLLELFANHRVDDVLDYPSLLFNIDTILPCPTCAWHYQQIKRSESVLSAVKEMSFARLVNGARYFHNLVTMHQNELPEFQSRPPRPPFTVLDYAERYGCLEDVPEDLVKTATYVRGWVDWQPPLHRRLTLFHAMRRSIPYAVASRRLKRVLYGITGSGGNDNDDDGVHRSHDSITRDELLRSIAEGMVGAVKTEYRETLQPYATSFYETYPAEAAAIAECLLPESDGRSLGVRENDTASQEDAEEVRRCAKSALARIHRATNGEHGRADLEPPAEENGRGRVNGNEAARAARNGARVNEVNANGLESDSEDDELVDVDGDVEMVDAAPLLPAHSENGARSTLRQRRAARRPV